MSDLRRRLAKLERLKPDSDRYSVDWLMTGTGGLMDWLRQHGYSDPLAALRAGCRGYILELDCLSWWLVGNGFRSVYSRGAAAEAVANGALRIVPPELEAGLRRKAFGDYINDAGFRILDNIGAVKEEPSAEWRQLMRCPDPVTDGLLARARQLLAELDRLGIPEARTDGVDAG